MFAFWELTAFMRVLQWGVCECVCVCANERLVGSKHFFVKFSQKNVRQTALLATIWVKT